MEYSEKLRNSSEKLKTQAKNSKTQAKNSRIRQIHLVYLPKTRPKKGWFKQKQAFKGPRRELIEETKEMPSPMRGLPGKLMILFTKRQQNEIS